MGLTEEQLAVRALSIGASEVAAVLGASQYAGPLEIFQAKTGGGEPFQSNRYTEFGTECERVVADLYERHYLTAFAETTVDDEQTIHYPTLLEGKSLVTQLEALGPVEHLCDGTFRRTDLPFLACTPDRIYSNLQRLVEIKWISSYSWKQGFCTHEKGPGKIKREYWIQLLYQMWFFGIHAGHLAVGFGGNAIRVFDVTYRQDSIDRMLVGLAQFWTWVDRGEPNPDWRPMERPNFPDRDPLPTDEEHARSLVTLI
jgi:predicted phage-related endonuclease